MEETNQSTSASTSKESIYRTRSGRISKSKQNLTNKTKKKPIVELITDDNNETKELSNKEKGDLLETRTYKALTNMGYLVIRYQDGHYDQDEKQYIGTGDGGIDMILHTEIATIYIQCKNWKSTIGTSILRSFIGALQKCEIENGDSVVGMIVANNFTNSIKNESKIIKRPQIVLTTLEDIEKTVTEILIKLGTETKKKITNTINITKAEYIQIEKPGTSITGIGKEIEVKIQDERTG
jgi:restriction endonuclease Mrr